MQIGIRTAAGLLVALAAIALLPPSAANGASPPVAFAAATCGDMGSRYPDYYDVRARREPCRSARRVVRGYASKVQNVFRTVTVRRHRCRGERSERRIKGASTFKITCRRGTTRRVTWFIRPFH